jgi:hypothetical protein
MKGRATLGDEAEMVAAGAWVPPHSSLRRAESCVEYGA